MTRYVDRRRFLQAGGTLLAAAALPEGLVRGASRDMPAAEKRFRKAVGWEMIQGDLSVEDKLRLAKDIGFEGVEVSTHLRNPNVPEPKVLAAASEKTGVPIHGVVHSSHPDLKGAIDEAVILGATSVLHVVPTDPKGSYLENYKRTQETIRHATAHAEKNRVFILVENVWATFLIEPLTMARYIDELNSPYVKAYFDIGNVVRWGWPQHWIEVLGERIGKIHLKEYNLKVAVKEGMLKGFDFPMGESDIDWKLVFQRLKEVDYRGWATAEVAGGDRQRLADVSAQMDRVLAL